MFPVTVPVGHVAPPVPTQVHEALATWGSAVTASLTVAATAASGPALATTIV